VQPRKFRILSAITAGSIALAVAAITASSGTSQPATHPALAAQNESFPPVNLDACPTLHTGYPTGGCVAQLQTDLNIIQGNHLAVDGIFGSVGSQTYKAVIAFQQAHGLPQDGMVGPATKQALDAALSVPTPVLSPVATSVPYPPLNWLAGTSNSPYAEIQLNSTDPINLVLHDPSGHASDLVEEGLTASGHWFRNNCYNRSVVLPVDDSYAAYNVTDKPPVTSFATDTSNSGDVLWFHGCGSLGNVRDHMRLWRSQDNQTVWIAASEEIPTGSRFSPHRLADNAFNAGRDQLAKDLASGLLAAGHRYGACQCVAYSSAVQSYPSGSFQNIDYDGGVAFFNL
jgi:hypothetical protein